MGLACICPAPKSAQHHLPRCPACRICGGAHLTDQHELGPLLRAELVIGPEPEPDPEPSDLDVAAQEAGTALEMLTCPWYRTQGKTDRERGRCRSACQSEPACETGEPEGGWAAALLLAAAEVYAEARREER